MASTTTTSWMPAQGKYQVATGSSLRQALKTRKQGGTPPATNTKRNLPDKDFYSFRYNFKPPSIDPTKPGTIEVRKGKDKTQVAVEHLSSQAGEAYVFTGTETQAKEWDCVLIYDEETGAYTLEKLDSFLNLTWERKRTSTARAASPAAPSPADRDAEGEDDDGELEKELLGLTEDKPLANAKPRQRPPAPRVPQKEEEEEDMEDIFIPTRDPTPPPPAPPPKLQSSKASRPAKPLPKGGRPSAAATEPPPPVTTAPPATSPAKSKAGSKPKKKQKEPETAVLSDPNVEVIEFWEPPEHTRTSAAATSAPKPSAASVGFALPGSSSSGIFQPPPAPPSKAQRVPAVPPQPALPTGADEDSEEEWEEVEGAAPPTYHSDNGEENDNIFGDDDGDGDSEDVLAQELAQELDEEMEEFGEGEEMDQDFLAAEMSKDIEAPVPMSLNKFAGGADDSDDDFSSSDDSDDD